MRKYKSVEVAIRSMRAIREKLPAAQLVIIGDGPHRSALEAETKRLDLGESVRFLGFVRDEALVEYLNRAHVLVNPSPKEGWGLTVVEANACGLPVVASDRPGLRDSVAKARLDSSFPTETPAPSRRRRSRSSRIERSGSG